MPFPPPRAPPPPRPPAYFMRARRPRPRTFAITSDDLARLDELAKQYRHRSKALRLVIRQFGDDQVRSLLPYAADPAHPPGSPRLVTVSLAVQFEDLQKLNRWTAAAPFPSRSALVRAMIRWASDAL